VISSTESRFFEKPGRKLNPIQILENSNLSGLAAYFAFYNEKRWHQNFDRKTPAMVYFNTLPQKQAAA
jgi:hypothetical protein